MIYLIGGVPRSGKSTLARKMLQAEGIPYFNLDLLMNGLTEGAPELGFKELEDPDKESEKLWPIVFALIKRAGEQDETNYLIEGMWLTPKYLQAARETFHFPIKCCVLGYPDITPEERASQIRQYRGGAGDWLGNFSPDAIHARVTTFIEQSKKLRENAEHHGIRFFDVSENFDHTLLQAQQYLLKP